MTSSGFPPYNDPNNPNRQGYQNGPRNGFAGPSPQGHQGQQGYPNPQAYPGQQSPGQQPPSFPSQPNFAAPQSQPGPAFAPNQSAYQQPPQQGGPQPEYAYQPNHQTGYQTPPAARYQPARSAMTPEQRQTLRRLPLYGANPIEAFARYFSKFAVFSGRASRSEYWWMQFWRTLVDWVVLPIMAGIISAIAVIPIVSIADSDDTVVQIHGIASAIIIVGTFVAIALVAQVVLTIPSLALRVRRLHDSGHSGWWSAFWLASSITAFLSLCGIAGVAMLYYLSDVAGPLSQYSDDIARDTGMSADQIERALEAVGNGVTEVIGISLGILTAVALLGGLIAFVFDLVVGLLGTDPAGQRFDAKREAVPEAITTQATPSPDVTPAAKTATTTTSGSTPTAQPGSPADSPDASSDRNPDASD